ncbi:MAG: LPP20 family lipoprotein [Gammaproteobacteria bacterium]|nr:LPP20 family lipoprotein [Gammaproteobacteria bacterium]MBU1776090.1 LPP20 family lipoprotein [Gammaproteobacteria bacterium]MBU1969585.1 LPP20 family lipoprotein [Gammaproteobacteria bacterium]
MKLSTYSAIALALTLLSGCASQPTVPDWVAGNSAKYTSEQYLTGRGQAATQEEAKDRARADVAKVFQVAVVVSSDDIQRAKSDSSGALQYEQQASRQISTRTDKIISGIQIAELWQDPASGNHHALAILPRQQTATSLRQQIGELDATTRTHIEQSRKADDLFMKIAAASRAFEVQQEREALQKNLQVVDITGRGMEAQWSSAKLKSDMGELLKRVSIAPRVTKDSPAGLKEMVAGALAQSGFVLDTGNQPQFVVQANMNLVDLGLKDGWYWQRGSLEITLIETAGNRIRGTRQWIVKGNAQNKEGSTRRAMDQADAILKQELGGAIIEMVIAR